MTGTRRLTDAGSPLIDQGQLSSEIPKRQSHVQRDLPVRFSSR